MSSSAEATGVVREEAVEEASEEDDEADVAEDRGPPFPCVALAVSAMTIKCSLSERTLTFRNAAWRGLPIVRLVGSCTPAEDGEALGSVCKKSVMVPRRPQRGGRWARIRAPVDQAGDRRTVLWRDAPYMDGSNR